MKEEFNTGNLEFSELALGSDGETYYRVGTSESLTTPNYPITIKKEESQETASSTAELKDHSHSCDLGLGICCFYNFLLTL